MKALTPNPAWLEGAAYDVVSRRHHVDRRRVPSVTQALAVAFPFRFVGIPPDVLARKAAIGTAVHAAAHYHAEGDLLEASLAPEVQPRFLAWRWFCQSRQVEPLLCEPVVCSRDLRLPAYRRRPYVGKLDFLCRVDRSRIVLLDLKTGSVDLARLQTLAYLDALYQQYPQLIAVDVERWAVELTADGRHVVHVFRDDAIDATDFRDALDRAYEAPDADWSRPMPESDALFDLPDDAPMFELPDDALPVEVLPPEPIGGIRELVITPDVEAYLAQLETAVAPFEAAATAFAADMETAPIATPEALAALGQQSLYAKVKEDQIDDLFEPAIRKPRLYLDRVYAVKRRVIAGWKAGGDIAARRYTARKRELEEADRRARLEADRVRREAELRASLEASEERRRLAEQATQAAQAGNAKAAADLIEQARAVEPQRVELPPAPVLVAPAADVRGLTAREGWAGEVTDILDAVLAAARPHVMREIAAMVESGDLTAGGQGIATTMIAEKLRALASELPHIPATMFTADAGELKKRAAADRDTLQWPGFRFYQTTTPVRRTTRKHDVSTRGAD